MAKDICAVAGVLLIAIGLWTVSPPASIVTVGAILLTAALFGHLRTAAQKPIKPEGDDK